jgi:hypothetical protein
MIEGARPTIDSKYAMSANSPKANLQPDDFGSYKGAAADETLRSIQDYLESADAMIRMETASELVKPAAEALSAQLTKRFGEVVKKDRVKQFIGWYIRKVMEAHGFSLDQQNCKVCSPNNIFTRGARYRRNVPVCVD